MERKPHSLKKVRGRFGENNNVVEFTTAREFMRFMFDESGSDSISVFSSYHTYQNNIKIGKVLKEVNAMSKRNMGIYDGSKKDAQVMIQPEMRDALRVAGRVLVDLADITDRIILPEFGDEMHNFIAQVVFAHTQDKPINIFTPCCPDWSRDSKGQYDFKSLGGEVSFIARKVFREVPPVLRILNKHGIPYNGTLVLANYGSETEITAKDTYGRKLSADDIQMCFASSLAKTDEELSGLQKNDSGIFNSYRVIPMTEFFDDQGIDEDQILGDACEYFKSDSKGKKLVSQLHRDSIGLNKGRLGLSEEENLEQTIRGCAEYGVFGYAMGQQGVILAAESRTTSRAYNLFRRSKGQDVMPLFYLKGRRGVNEGVNIL